MNTGAVTISSALPAGANSIGAVTQGGSWAVSVSGSADTNVASWGGGTTTLGQKVLASSVPVAIASDQALPLPSGASTGAKQDTGNTSLASIDTKLTSPLTVQATNLDIRDLTFASDKVDATGSSVTVS